ncbi:hypothetical protein SELMODRAFT_425029 [Selaginella moellendorffii]|uniref:Uncharacterized protein n=1 Tax=Selaginella moellendorffii TaxID=88036 RepID=D8SRT3_SELML|nr:hypothetical protein SELMODRAFT_425029 [Selaginella moellendorffii]
MEAVARTSRRSRSPAKRAARSVTPLRHTSPSPTPPPGPTGTPPRHRRSPQRQSSPPLARIGSPSPPRCTSCRSPPPPDRKGRIHRGRGFSQAYSDARRYHTPSPDRSGDGGRSARSFQGKMQGIGI